MASEKTPNNSTSDKTAWEKTLEIVRIRIKDSLRIAGAVNEKSLEGLTDSAKMDRLRRKQFSLLNLMTHFVDHPTICAEEIANFEKAPFTVCKSVHDVERESLQTYKLMLSMVWENDIKSSKDIAHIMDKIGEASCFFEAFWHTELEHLRTFTAQRDSFIEQGTKHVAIVLLDVFDKIENKDKFKALSLHELTDMQKGFDYFHRFNAVNDVLKNAFRLITKDDSFAFPLLQKIYHDNDFIKGYLKFRLALDKENARDISERAASLRQAVACFQESNRPILSEHTLGYLDISEREVRELAAKLNVSTPPFHKQMPLSFSTPSP